MSLPSDKAVQFTVQLMDVIADILGAEDVGTGRPYLQPDRVNAFTFQRLQGAVYETYTSSLARQATDCLGRLPEGRIQSTGIGFSSDFDLFVKLGFLLSDRVVLWNAVLDGVLFSNVPVDAVTLCRVVEPLLSLRPIASAGGIVLLPHPMHWSERYRYYASSLQQINDLSTDVLGIVNAQALIDDGYSLHPYAMPESPFYAAIHRGLLGNTDLYRPEKVEFQSTMARLLSEAPYLFPPSLDLSGFFRAVSEVGAQCRVELRRRLDIPSGLSEQEREHHLDSVLMAVKDEITTHAVAAARHDHFVVAKAAGAAAGVGTAVAATVVLAGGSSALGSILSGLGSALSAYAAVFELLEKLSSRPREPVLFKLCRRMSEEETRRVWRDAEASLRQNLPDS